MEQDGVIKRLVTDRGFGFIRTNDGGEYFFHKSCCLPPHSFHEMTEGDAVVFEMGKSDKGPRAEQVRLV